MTWHRPRGPRRGPLPKGAARFLLKVSGNAHPEGAREYPELREVVTRKLKDLEAKAAHTQAAKATYCTQKAILNRALAELPERPVPADLRAWMNALVTRWGCTRGTANKFRDTVSGAYEFDRARGGMVNNPCADVPRLRVSAPLRPALSNPAAGLFAAQTYRASRELSVKLHVPNAQRFPAYLGLAYVLGLRRSEVCGFEPHHFFGCGGAEPGVRLVQQRIPSARDGEPQALKTEKRRVLPLPRSLGDEIAAFLNLPAWVPPSVRGSNQFRAPVRSRYVFPFATADLNALHEAIRAELGEEVLPVGNGVHQFRHAFAEAALDYYKSDYKEVARRMGHSSPAVTIRYAAGRFGTHEIRRDEGLFSKLENLSTEGPGVDKKSNPAEEKSDE